MAYCCSRPIHSIIIKMSNKTKRLVGRIVGKENKDLENISAMILKACVKPDDLKNIHAKTASPNVIPIENNSLKFGKYLPCATISRLSLCVLKMIDGIIYRAFNNPHTIKVQFAPCQKPLTRKMMNVLRTFIQVPPLLPPRGIYR